MGLTASHGRISTNFVDIHVYSYEYEESPGYLRNPGRDVLALFTAPPRGATGRYRYDGGKTASLPLGSLIAVPADVAIEANGGTGNVRLATCGWSHGMLPHDIDLRTDDQLRLCSNVQDRNVRLGMQRLVQEALSPGFASELLVEGVARGLQADLARYFGCSAQAQQPCKGGTLAPWQLRRIEDYASEMSGSPIRVTKLAQEVGISPGHLMRAFRQSTGQTVHEFIVQIRVARACTLLADPQKPIKQIAAELGFATHSSFALAFRRATGETPMEFRHKTARLQ